MGLTRRSPILLKKESSYGVDPSPVAGTDGILVENPEVTLENIVVSDRNGVRQTLATLQKVVGDTLYGIKFAVELKGSGSAGTAPEIGPALECCGMGETIVGGTSVAYAPSSDEANRESCTIYAYQDGELYKLLGCRGSVECVMTADKVAMLNFTFVGHRDGTVSDTAVITPTLSIVVPPVMKAGTLTLNSVSHVVPEVKWGLNNNLSIRGDISAVDGFAPIRIVGRDVTLGISPEAVAAATHNHIAQMLANASEAFATGAIGAAGNQVQVACPAAAYRGISIGDREGVRIKDLELGCAESSGDDELTITFT